MLTSYTFARSALDRLSVEGTNYSIMPIEQAVKEIRLTE